MKYLLLSLILISCLNKKPVVKQTNPTVASGDALTVDTSTTVVLATRNYEVRAMDSVRSQQITIAWDTSGFRGLHVTSSKGSGTVDARSAGGVVAVASDYADLYKDTTIHDTKGKVYFGSADVDTIKPTSNITLSKGDGIGWTAESLRLVVANKDSIIRVDTVKGYIIYLQRDSFFRSYEKEDYYEIVDTNGTMVEHIIPAHESFSHCDVHMVQKEAYILHPVYAKSDGWILIDHDIYVRGEKGDWKFPSVYYVWISADGVVTGDRKVLGLYGNLQLLSH